MLCQHRTVILKPHLKALIFDSEYDPYRGAISSIRIIDGVVKAGDRIKMMATGKEFEVTEESIHPSNYR